MKRRLNRFRQIVGLFIALAVTAYGQQACADVLDVGPDGVLAVRINDTPAKLQVRGDWISYLTLNPDATERLGVSSGMFSSMVGIQATVGTTVISGHTGKAKFAVDSKETKERVLWFDKVAAPQIDGAIGPASLPQPQVRLNIGVGVQNATAFKVPMKVNDRSYGTQIVVGDATVFVMVNPLRQDTVASAAAGQVLSAVYGGKWTGAGGSVVEAFGVERPVRELSLASPVQIGSLRVERVLVRDFARVKGVAEDEAAQTALDPSEVTLPAVSVTANARSKVKAAYYLTLGRDVLVHCASVTFDKVANQIEFACQ